MRLMYFPALQLFFIAVLSAAVQRPIIEDETVFPEDKALQDLEAALPRIPGLLPRVKPMIPVAKPCYNQDRHDVTQQQLDECQAVRLQRTNDVFMTNQPGGYYFGNWGTCQRYGEGCTIPTLLDPKAPEGTNGSYISPAATCHQGAVPEYYIDVRSSEDVKEVFKRSKELNRPIVIKNTGHDWKGRSSAPGALALWTHNIKHPNHPMAMLSNFTAEGCSSKHPDGPYNETVLRFGAGEQWSGVYEFTNKSGRAILGGTCPTVGAVGWVFGGGHSPLSPTLGLGVDAIRQIRIVTPLGEEKIASRCQNADLFNAIKGGGGGTYGVVMEVWYQTVDIFNVQEFTLHLWGLDVHLIREFLEILAANAVQWSKNGWGGYINTARQNRTLTIVHPRATEQQSEADMAPLINFALRIKAPYVLRPHDSWYRYFQDAFGEPSYHKSMWGAAVASRLIPPSAFDGKHTQKKLVDTLLDLHYSRVNFIIMLVTPSKFPADEVQSSTLHPSWRNATWLIRINDSWDSFYIAATSATSHKNFERVHKAMDQIRKLTPDMGVSINEADIWEPRHELAFWGAANYEELAKTKQKHDPDNVLRVIQGIGAKEWDERFRCYPRQEDL